MKQVSDYAARQAAVDPRRSFIVQAPAGSGKTELLTDRMLALLATVQRPEQLLAITFTKKAAAEMRDRVFRKLEAAKGPAPTEAHLQQSWQLAQAVLQKDAQENWQLLRNPARLKIQTIDAFCQALLRQTPSLSGVGASLEPSDAADSLFASTAQALLERIDQEPCIQAVLQHLDVQLPRFEQLMISMLHKRQIWLPLVQNPVASLSTMVETLYSVVTTQLQALQQAFPATAIADIGDLVRRIAYHQPADSPYAPWAQWQQGQALGTTIDDLPYWEGLSHFMLTQKGGLRKQADAKVSAPLSKEEKAYVKQWLSQFSDQPALLQGLWQTQCLPHRLVDSAQLDVMSQFFQCLRLLEATLQDTFRTEGTLDFTEMAQRALQALGNAQAPSELLLKIDMDLRHILIDEFQDTNIAQKTLLTQLCSGWERHDGRTLFLVGDPMQSIYRFRNAEVALFLDIAEKAQRNQDLPESEQRGVIGEVVMHYLQLCENFRSDAGIIDWVNLNFSQVFPEADTPELGGIRYSPSQAFRPVGADPAVQAYPFYYAKTPDDALADHCPGMCYDNREQADRMMAEHTVALIREAQQRGHGVAVLVRSRSHVDTLYPLLREAGVPVRAVNMEPLGHRPEVQDLLQLLRALTHEGDRLAWLSVLRAPFCGFDLPSLSLLFEANTQQSVPSILRQRLADAEWCQAHLSEDARTRLHWVGQLLLQSHLEDDSLGARGERLWQQLGGDALYAQPAARKNVQTLLNVVDDIAQYGLLDLTLLEEKIKDLYAEPDTAPNAVSLMTMHAAKGLEFDEVILYGLHKIPRVDTGELLEIESDRGRLLMGLIKEKATGEEDRITRLIRQRNHMRAAYEEQRLFYVACTRAKKRLHMPYLQAVDSDPSSRSMLRFLRALPPGAVVHSHQPATVTSQPTPHGFQWHRPLLQRYTQAYLRQQQRHLPEATATLSPRWVFDNGSAAAEGTVVHHCLEQLGRQGLVPDSFQRWRPMVQYTLQTLGVDSDTLAASTDRVMQLMDTLLHNERVRTLIQHPNAKREWVLHNSDGQHKVIDVVLFEPEADVIVDYKTNAPNTDESPDAFAQRLIQSYSDQLRHYAQWVQALRQRPVKAVLFALQTQQWIEVL